MWSCHSHHPRAWAAARTFCDVETLWYNTKFDFLYCLHVRLTRGYAHTNFSFNQLLITGTLQGILTHTLARKASVVLVEDKTLVHPLHMSVWSLEVSMVTWHSHFLHKGWAWALQMRTTCVMFLRCDPQTNTHFIFKHIYVSVVYIGGRSSCTRAVSLPPLCVLYYQCFMTALDWLSGKYTRQTSSVS